MPRFPEAERNLQALLREEPFVRRLAHELCASSTIDPEEVAQQAWVRALEHGGSQVRAPRSWLARITRNVLASMHRGELRRRAREHTAAHRGHAPSSAELLLREECRQTLIELVDSLPPAEREVVLLRYFEGLPPREIAARRNVPAKRVHALLRQGLDRLRQHLDTRAGDQHRAALLLPLFASQQAARPSPIPALPTVALPGTLLMNTKSIVAAAAAVLLLIAAYATWPSQGSTEAGQPDGSPKASTAQMTSQRPPETKQDTDRDARPTTRAVPNSGVRREPLHGFGTVRVTVRARTESGLTPTHGSMIKLASAGLDYREAQRARTDESGRVEFYGVEPGRFRVWGDRGESATFGSAVAGDTTDCSLEFRSPITLRGRVVDPHGNPVPEAAIEVSVPGLYGRDPAILAKSGPDGRFSIVAAPRPSVIGARKAGYRSSPLQFAMGKSRPAEELEFRLQPGGGIVEGIVLDPSGSPRANALVKVGIGRIQGVHIVAGSTTRPALAYTDARGRFVTFGIAAGNQPIAVRASGLITWRGTCTVAEFVTTSLRIHLRAGAALHGVIYDSANEPVTGAEVAHGEWGDFGRVAVHSDKQGRYRLSGLPDGEVRIKVSHDSAGKLNRAIRLAQGERRAVDLRVDRGLELTGNAVDAEGLPVKGIRVTAISTPDQDGLHSRQYQETDSDGHFAMPNCPPDQKITLELRSTDIEPLDLPNIEATGDTLEIRVTRTEPRSARIRGRVLGRDDQPCVAAQVSIHHVKRLTESSTITDASGNFELGPLHAGEWRLQIRHPNHAPLATQRQHVADDSIWDLGTLRLDAGGRAILRPLVGALSHSNLSCSIYHDETRQQVVRPTGGRMESKRLPPGHYTLLVRGEQLAAQAIPFEIRSGRDTEVMVATDPGVRQHIVFVEQYPTRNAFYGAVRIESEGTRIVQRWLRHGRGGPWAMDIALQPGRYTVLMTGALRGTREFVVPASGSPASVQVQVQ